MPEIKSEPIVPHIFAGHEFSVLLAASDDDIASVRAAFEKEVRDLLPSRVAWRNTAVFSWASDSTLVTVSDQRCATFLTSTLRRHRVLRVAQGELRLKGGDDAGGAAAAASAERLNFDEELAKASAKYRDSTLVPQCGSSTGAVTVAAVADFVAKNGSFLGAYTADGAANPVVAAAFTLKGVASLPDLVALAHHKSRYVRATALVFARYAIAPEDLGPVFGLPAAVQTATAKDASNSWADAPIFDSTVVQFDDEGSQGPMRQFARSLLLEDEVYELWLPTYAAPVLEALRRRLDLADNKLKAVTPSTAKTVGGSAQEAAAAAAATATLSENRQRKQAAQARMHSAVIPGFKSAAAMANYVRKAYELATQGSTASMTDMGSKSIAVRKTDDNVVTFAAPGGASLPTGLSDEGGGNPQGVAARSREALLADLKTRRMNRLRGSVAPMSQTLHRAVDPRRDNKRPRPQAPSSATDAAVDAVLEPEAPLWPSEIVGPFNTHGVIDDLFASNAKQQVLFSTTVGPDDIEMTF
jgi:hypothetical protein